VIVCIARVAKSERLPQLISCTFEIVLVDEESTFKISVGHSPTHGQKVFIKSLIFAFKLLREPFEVGLTVL